MRSYGKVAPEYCSPLNPRSIASAMSLSVRPPVEQNCRRCNSPVTRSKNADCFSVGNRMAACSIMTRWLGFRASTLSPVEELVGLGHGVECPGAVRDCHAGPAESSIAIAMAHPSMSALGQKQTSRLLEGMSALPPKADIGTQSRNVRFVLEGDVMRLNGRA